MGPFTFARHDGTIARVGVISYAALNNGAPVITSCGLAADRPVGATQTEGTELRQRVCAASSELAAVHNLAMEFRRMLDTHDPNALVPWLDSAECSELRSLAAGLRRDRDAVLAAILFRWNNGQVEGQVNRLKLIKRTMYGKAGFQLLRRRVLAA